MSRPKRIGLFGGTFDPIHNTHLDIARTALDAARLDVVHFVVAARPPHKRAAMHAPADVRLEMVRAAVDDDPRLEASDVELRREGYSYTADTVCEYGRLHRNAELFLIIGYDSLLDLPRWHEPRRILDCCKLLVVPRAGMEQRPDPDLQGKYEMLPFRESDLSSTEIRERVAAGKPIAGLVPPAVERIIRDKGVYRHADRRQPAR